MKILICGSRKDFNKDDAIELLADILMEIPLEDEIIHGGAMGIDMYANGFFKARCQNVKTYRPDYAKYGKEAPLIRDKEMVDKSDKVIAFWNGKSTGTKYTIDYARKKGKPVDIYILT